MEEKKGILSKEEEEKVSGGSNQNFGQQSPANGFTPEAPLPAGTEDYYVGDPTRQDPMEFAKDLVVEAGASVTEGSFLECEKKRVVRR